MVDFKDQVLVFFRFSFFIVVSFYYTRSWNGPFPMAYYTNSHGSSFEHDVNFAQFGFIREMSVGLRKSSGHLPCMAFLECTSEWTSSSSKRFAVFSHHLWQKETLSTEQQYQWRSPSQWDCGVWELESSRLVSENAYDLTLFINSLMLCSHVREDYISFPSSGRALGNVIKKLELKYGLLEAADVIDATHMKIKKIVKHCVIERGQSWIRNPWRHVYLFRLVWGVARVWYFLYTCGEQNKPFF